MSKEKKIKRIKKRIRRLKKKIKRIRDLKCDGCHHYTKRDIPEYQKTFYPNGVGQCKRYPKAIEKATGDWCGEWQRK